MNPDRFLPLQDPEEVGLQGRQGPVALPAHHVGDAHIVIVHDLRQEPARPPAGPDEDGVGEFGGRVMERAAHRLGNVYLAGVRQA